MEYLQRLRIWPWLVWGLGAMFALYTFLLQGAPSVMIPQLMQTYQIDPSEIGILTSSFFYTYIVMQIPAGILVDLWGPRRILKVGFLFCSIAVGWFAFSRYFWEGQVSRMLMGLFASPGIICAFCLGSRWFKPALFTLIVALTEFFALSGGIIGEGGLAKTVVFFGWRRAMLIVAVCGLLLTFLSLFIIHDYPDHDQPLHNGLNFRETLRTTWKSFVKIVAIKKLWISGIYAGLVFGIFPAFAALWGIPYFMVRYGIPVERSALLASTYFLGAGMGTLALGWISVHITHRRPLMIWGALCSFLLSLSVLYLPGIPINAMFVLMFVFGFFSSTYALSYALNGTYVSQEVKGVAMGFTNMLCIALGAPLFQPLIGSLLENTSNNYPISLAILPLSLLAAFILAFFIKEAGHTSDGNKSP